MSLQLKKADTSTKRELKDRFGNPISEEMNVIVSHPRSVELVLGVVCKITEKSIFVDIGYGTKFWRRQVPIKNIQTEIINAEVLRNETDNN